MMWFKRVVFVLLVIYLLLGCFPFSPVESDSVAISNGAIEMGNSGLGENFFTYRYHAQPGTYWFIRLVHNLTGLSVFASFSWLAIFSGLIFITLFSYYLSRILRFDFYLTFFTFLLFQEVFSELYYPSSTVLSAAFLAIAFGLLGKDKNIWKYIGAVVFAISIWIRFDAIIVTPLLLFSLNSKDWKISKAKLFVVLICGVSILGLYYVSKASLLSMLNDASSHMQLSYEDSSKLSLINSVDFRSHVTIFTCLTLFLFVAGLVNLWLKNKKLLILVLAGLIPFYLVFAGKITTPKYLYYYLPLFVIPIIQFWKSFKQKKIMALVLVLGLQYVVGFRVNLNSKPHMLKGKPTICELIKLEYPQKNISKISAVIGAGIPIPTVDYYRLSSGIIFSPLFWHNEKRDTNKELLKLEEYLEKSQYEELTLITTRYSSFQTALLILNSAGYSKTIWDASEDDYNKICILEKGNKKVKLIKRYYEDKAYLKRDASNLIDIFNEFNSQSVLFFTNAPWEQYHLKSSGIEYIQVTNSSYKIL